MPETGGANGTTNGNGGGESRQAWSPPYISFTNLLHLLERLENNLPNRIDRSFLTGSNAVNTMTLATLRALDLIDGDGVPQPTLHALAESPDERKRILADVLRRWYPKPVELGSRNATQGQLEEAFAEWGISGDTRRKAIAFYLKAAKFAEIPVSPNFRTPSVTRSDGAPRRNTNARRKQAAPAPERGQSEAPAADAKPTAETDTSKLAELRTRYIEMLVKKVDEQEELDTDLLNRIENLLGFDAPEEE